MKRETLRHPKTLDLAARLDKEHPTVLGYLTLLWDFTAEFAPQGNIGKFPDGAIARACGWVGKAEDFVEALVASNWIDRDPAHRLLIHHWQDHCERWIKAKLDKLSMPFATPSKALPQVSADDSAEETVERSTEPTTEPSPPRNQTKPNQSNPNPDQTKPKDEAPAVAVAGGTRKKKVSLPEPTIPEALDTPEFREAWQEWLQHYREKHQKPPTPTAMSRQFKKFAEWGVAKSIEHIHGSIERNWSAVYPGSEGPRRKESRPLPQGKPSGKPVHYIRG